MDVATYHQEYTNGKPFTLSDLAVELFELMHSLLSFDRGKIVDEMSDVSVFIQLWYFCRFGHNAPLWRSSLHNLAKVKQRKKVWRKIYRLAGLPQDISNYCGNYLKKEKMVRQLTTFGVEEKRIIQIHNSLLRDTSQMRTH